MTHETKLLRNEQELSHQQFFYFHEAKFSELFEDVKPWVRGMSDNPEFKIHKDNDFWLYCTTYDHESIAVKPCKELREFVADTMLHHNGVTVQLTDRHDGETLISLRYDQIIGSRWLTLASTKETKQSTERMQ